LAIIYPVAQFSKPVIHSLGSNSCAIREREHRKSYITPWDHFLDLFFLHDLPNTFWLSGPLFLVFPYLRPLLQDSTRNFPPLSAGSGSGRKGKEKKATGIHPTLCVRDQKCSHKDQLLSLDV
jgi:hypothetical protein